MNSYLCLVKYLVGGSTNQTIVTEQFLVSATDLTDLVNVVNAQLNQTTLQVVKNFNVQKTGIRIYNIPEPDSSDSFSI